MPLPEPYLRHWINAPFEDIELFTADQLRAAREQIAAEGDEVIGRLCRVVNAHVSDLRACIPTLKGFGLSDTATEVAQACDELSAALAEARKA